MKKIALLLVLVLALSVVFSGCTGTQKKLVMGTESGFAPYEYMKGNQVVGVDVDIANEIAKAMGATLEIQDMAFDAIIPAVSSGKVDFGAAGMSVTEERLKEVDFSIEYAVSKQIIVVKNDSTITGPDDLNGKSVGVQLGTVADLVISDEYPDIKVQQYNKYLEAVEALKNNKIDAIVMDILPAQEILKANSGYKILDKEFFTDKYAIAVKKGNAELLGKINEVLNTLIKNGKITEYTINHTTK